MGKLTVEILSNYLPYGLQAEMLDYERDYVNKQYDTIVGLHQWDKNGQFWSVLTAGGSKPAIDRVKPIFYPLSFLTKEMKFGNCLVVPVDYVSTSIKDSQRTCRIAEENGTLDIIEYWKIERLVSLRLDVFGLVQKGLALDASKLKGVYND